MHPFLVEQDEGHLYANHHQECASSNNEVDSDGVKIHGFDYRCSHTSKMKSKEDDGRATMSKPFSIKESDQFTSYEDYINSRFITISHNVLKEDESIRDP